MEFPAGLSASLGAPAPEGFAPDRVLNRGSDHAPAGFGTGPTGRLLSRSGVLLQRDHAISARSDGRRERRAVRAQRRRCLVPLVAQEENSCAISRPRAAAASTAATNPSGVFRSAIAASPAAVVPPGVTTIRRSSSGD